MSRVIRLLIIGIRHQLLQWSGSRWFVITLVVGQAVGPMIGLLVWSAALPGSARVSTYYVALLAVQLGTVSYENHTFSNAIYAGGLGHELLRPQPVVLGPVAENVAIRLWHLAVGAPLIVLAGLAMGVSFSPSRVLLALPCLALAASIRFLFTYMLALSAIWTQQAHAIVGFGETLIFLLGGSAAPIGFLPHPLNSIGAALPFWGMLGLPAEVAGGTLGGLPLALACLAQLGWLAALTLAVRGTWLAGVRRYTAVGG